MATVGVVKAIITADVTELKKGMNEAQRSLDNFSQNATKIGKSMTMKVTAPLVGLGVASGKMASDFEFSMTQIETLVGRSAEEVESLKGHVLALSGETGRAPKELADAMFFITSAGLDAEAATKALEASAKAAAIGMGDTVVVADAVTNAMNGYGMSADGAAYATDVLVKTVEQGKAAAAELAPQFGNLVPFAAELGISFDQLGAGMAFLTRATGNASRAATGLKGIMSKLIKPSEQGKKELEALGMSAEGLRMAVREKGLLVALNDLKAGIEANGGSMSKVFEDVEGLSAVLQLTGPAAEQAQQVFDELANSTGKLETAFEGVQKTAKHKMSVAMAGMQASLITLGQQVLPVVIPMIQKLAETIGKLAEWFGDLSPTVQRVIVIFGGVVAAVGPLLLVVGTLTNSFNVLSAAALKAGTTIGAVIAPLGILMGVVAGGFLIWSKWKDAEKKAREEMTLLKDEMIAAGEASIILSTDVEGLTDRLKKLAETSKEAVEEQDEFNQSMVLLQQLIDRDVRESFQTYFKDMEHHNTLVSQGSDVYDYLNETLNENSMSLDSNIAILEEHKSALGKDADMILEHVANGKLEIDTLREMLDALDETADAHDNVAEETKKTAEEFFESAENIKAYEDALDAGTVASINQMVAQGDLQGAMEKVIRETGYLETKTQQMADAAKAGTEDVNGLETAMEDIAEATAQATVELTDYQKEMALLMATSADRAMLSGASGRQFGEDLTDAAHWIEVVRVQREATAAAEQAIVDEELRQEKIQQRALKLANDIQKAKQEINSLEAEQTAIQDERQRTLEEIASINDEIAGLMEDQALFSATNVEFAAEIAQEFRKAELAIMNLEEKIADLQEEVDAVPPDDTTQREFVNKLKSQRAQVNAVEEALIDMNVIKEEDAGFMDLTAAEAQTLVRLQEQLQQTQLDMEAGEATTLDLMAAEEAWVKGMQNAMEASRELQKAEADLADMETKAIQIEKDRKKAMLELEIAQYDLAEAKKVGTEETYLAMRAEEEQAKVEEVINGLLETRTGLQEKQTDLALKEIQVVDELKYANERLKSVMEELNNLGEDGNDIWRELMELIHATTGEFRDLIGLLKTKGAGGSAGAGAGAGAGAVIPTTAVASTASAVTDSGVVVNEWTTMLAGLTDAQRGLVGQLYEDVERERGRGMLAGHSWGGSGVTVNVQGSVISEADLTNAINLALQDITRSGGTGPSYAGLDTYVDFEG